MPYKSGSGGVMNVLGRVRMWLRQWAMRDVPPPRMPRNVAWDKLPREERRDAFAELKDDRERDRARTDGAYSRAQLLTATQLGMLAVFGEVYDRLHPNRVLMGLAFVLVGVAIIPALMAAKPRHDRLHHRNPAKDALDLSERYYLERAESILDGQVRLRWRQRQLHVAMNLTIWGVASVLVALLLLGLDHIHVL